MVDHAGFETHVVGHLLIGMLVPLLLVLATPVTRVLRALPVAHARRLSHLLRSRPIRWLTEPAVAAALDVGSLWAVYPTGLYPLLHQRVWLAALVHLHMLATGYLFTSAMIGRDPMPHRRGFGHRAIVLVLAVAAHDILAKHLYAAPPVGVDEAAAHRGAMIMYYGGDAVGLVIIIVFCLQWSQGGFGLRRTAGRPAPQASAGR